MNIHDAIQRLSSQLPNDRNQAAIELMDAGDPAAIEPLIQAIEKPENRTARGTLIYALSAFRCEGRFRQLFTWATQGGYEASRESLAIIRDQELSPSDEDRPHCEKLLATLQANGDDELLRELESLLFRNGQD